MEINCHGPRLVEALLGRRTAAVVCGGFHTACLNEAGAVYTWGGGDHGQLEHALSVEGEKFIIMGRALDQKKVCRKPSSSTEVIVRLLSPPLSLSPDDADFSVSLAISPIKCPTITGRYGLRAECDIEEGEHGHNRPSFPRNILFLAPHRPPSHLNARTPLLRP